MKNGAGARVYRCNVLMLCETLMRLALAHEPGAKYKWQREASSCDGSHAGSHGAGV